MDPLSTLLPAAPCTYFTRCALQFFCHWALLAVVHGVKHLAQVSVNHVLHTHIHTNVYSRTSTHACIYIQTHPQEHIHTNIAANIHNVLTKCCFTECSQRFITRTTFFRAVCNKSQQSWTFKTNELDRKHTHTYTHTNPHTQTHYHDILKHDCHDCCKWRRCQIPLSVFVYKRPEMSLTPAQSWQYLCE